MKRARSSLAVADKSVAPSFSGLRLVGNPSARLFARVGDTPSHLLVASVENALSDVDLFAALGLDSGSGVSIFRRGKAVSGAIWVEIECGSGKAAAKAARRPLGGGGGGGVSVALSFSR